MGIRLRATLLSLMAVVLLLGLTGVVYARPDDSFETRRLHDRLDLKIRDQNQPWRDGVSGTWMAANMAPGQTFDFEGSFVGLKANDKGRLSVTADYRVIEDSPRAGSDGDPQTDLFPDRMAKELLITRLLYKYGGWQIDGLTGQAVGMSSKDLRTYSRWDGVRWRVPDVDGDGRITFYDLKTKPLTGLPLPDSDCQGARFVMSVRFADSAGNGLQGDIFDLTMRYGLGGW